MCVYGFVSLHVFYDVRSYFKRYPPRYLCYNDPQICIDVRLGPVFCFVYRYVLRASRRSSLMFLFVIILFSSRYGGWKKKTRRKKWMCIAWDIEQNYVPLSLQLLIDFSPRPVWEWLKKSKPRCYCTHVFTFSRCCVFFHGCSDFPSVNPIRQCIEYRYSRRNGTYIWPLFVFTAWACTGIVFVEGLK